HLLHQSRFYAVPWLDPIVSLTYVAATTSRLRLGTSVLVLPTRQPVVLAKQVATLQALADERYILGVGTGWDDREFQAVGQQRAERGGRTDESIAIIRRLLAGEAGTYDGRVFQPPDVGGWPAHRPPPCPVGARGPPRPRPAARSSRTRRPPSGPCWPRRSSGGSSPPTDGSRAPRPFRRRSRKTSPKSAPRSRQRAATWARSRSRMRTSSISFPPGTVRRLSPSSRTPMRRSCAAARPSRISSRCP